MHSRPSADLNSFRMKEMAPQAGFEPATLRLTAGCSAVELLRNKECAAHGGSDLQYYRRTLRTVNARTASFTLISAPCAGDPSRFRCRTTPGCPNPARA